MNNWIATVAVTGSLFAIAGCESTGGREGPSVDYAASVLSMGAAGMPSTEPAQASLSPPIKIAVAQLGELAPPQWVLERLRKNSTTFVDVEGVPGSPRGGGSEAYSGEKHPTTVPAERDQMRRFAGSLGADYLFVYGATIDHSINTTSLNALDLTIIGAYVVPSQKVSASATVAGSLIDVRTGRLVLAVNADGSATKFSPTAQRDADDESLIQAVRNEAVGKLIDKLSLKVGDYARHT